MELQEILNLIDTKDGVLLYFTGKNCNVCHALKPKIDELFQNEFPLIERVYLDAHENPEVSAHFSVFSIPTLIVFLGGREFAREGRALSLHQLSQKIARPYSIMTGE